MLNVMTVLIFDCCKLIVLILVKIGNEKCIYSKVHLWMSFFKTSAYVKGIYSDIVRYM